MYQAPIDNIELRKNPSSFAHPKTLRFETDFLYEVIDVIDYLAVSSSKQNVCTAV